MKLLFALLLALVPVFAASAMTPGPNAGMSEAQKIEALIAAVEAQPGAVFIRNGSEYGAKQAASHLRMKWNRAGKRVKTAEDFIRLCASQSYLSGKKYQVRLRNGSTLDSSDYFHQQLRMLESAKRRPASPLPHVQPAHG